MFLVYGGDEELVVKGYVDASFDTDLDDSKSQTEYVYILNGGAVSWCSCKQSVVAGSTCEAEYIAASEAVPKTTMKLAEESRSLLVNRSKTGKSTSPMSLNGVINETPWPCIAFAEFLFMTMVIPRGI